MSAPVSLARHLELVHKCLADDDLIGASLVTEALELAEGPLAPDERDDANEMLRRCVVQLSRLEEQLEEEKRRLAAALRAHEGYGVRFSP